MDGLNRLSKRPVPECPVILTSGVVHTEASTMKYLYAGIFLLACFGVIHYFLYLRLRDAGHKKHIFNFLLFEVPVDYLRLGRKYAWSPWPAYFVWLVLVAGLILFIAGVFKLP
jgi:hypothetical protein